jgi:serine/threonine protein kinase
MHPAAEPAELQTAPFSLRYLSSVDEDWVDFIRRQSAALHRAIDTGKVSRVKALFERGGVHIGLRAQLIGPTMGGTGMLPLHRSAHVGSAEAIQILRCMLNEIPDCTPLKDKRAILDAHVGYGYTAYMVACEFGNLQAVELLVNAGCSTSLKNSFGQTGLDLAIDNKQDAVQRCLRARVSEHMFHYYGSKHGTKEEPELVQCFSSPLAGLNRRAAICEWLQRRAETHAELRREFERREMRPDVQSQRRDELEIAAERLTFWEAHEFETWERIGGGAYGDIYVVPIFPPLQLGSNGSGEPVIVRTVVVKAAVAADNQEALAALRDEIKALCSLRHVNIVRVYGFSFTARPVSPEDQEATASLQQTCGTTQDQDELLGAVRLARESGELSGGAAVDPQSYLETSVGREECKRKGESARRPTWALLLEQCDCDLAAPIYNRHPWSEGAALSWMRRLDFAQQMASGLAYIHAKTRVHPRGQVHWDLKPGNILMKRRADGEWTLKIADFGMGDGEPEDDASEPVGTPEYMAPEAWRGRPVAASDVFSFGLILWELCTQKRVHAGFPHFDLQVHTVDEQIPMWMATKDARPDIPAECPQPWALLIQACWAAESEARPNFADIKAALQAFEPVVAAWAEAVDGAVVVAQESAAAPSVPEWLKELGLETKMEALEAYIGDAETVADEAFREFAQDADEYLEEMVEESDLTEDEAATLKVALQDLGAAEPQPAPESRADPWHELCGMLNIQTGTAASEQDDHQQRDSAERVQELLTALAAKDGELSAKNGELAAKDRELRELRARLGPAEEADPPP